MQESANRTAQPGGSTDSSIDDAESGRTVPTALRFNRREVLKRTAGAGIAGIGFTGTATARAADTEAPDSLTYYDLSYVHDYDLGDPDDLAEIYERMHFVSTLQGNVNRDAVRLFVNLLMGDQFTDLNIDQYWFEKLRGGDGWLADRSVTTIEDIDGLLHEFREHVRGAVVYDPSVYATSNVASTVAGVEELVAIPYDTRPNSLYSNYVEPWDKGMTLPVKEWLVNRDGTSRFTGEGTIPGTDHPSTGSAKCDAYIWAKIKYLDNGRCNATELAYYLDRWWIERPMGPYPADHTLLTNHDYLVAQRGFLFDLCPWPDVKPIDDPDQPLGTDRATLEAILRSAYEQRGAEMAAANGFVPWPWKYTSFANDDNPHPPVPSEWKFVQIASAFDTYVEADAANLGPMANASLYQHYPVQEQYSQNPKPTLDDARDQGFVDVDGDVSPRRYVAFYVGDYDSAAWLCHMIPQTWDDPNRGDVPLSWAFNPNLENRMAPALAYAYRTRTDNDYFVTGDSGAGYVNPGMLTEPRDISGLPSGLETWTEHCREYYDRWDMSATGFIIDGHAPVLEEENLGRSYAQFSPDGVAGQYYDEFGLVEDMPYTSLDFALGGQPDQAAARLANRLAGDLSTAPSEPQFYTVRTVLKGASWHPEVASIIQERHPNANVEFVDYYTLFALMEQFMENGGHTSG